MNESEFLKLIENYDNVIFDYGGILIDIDYEKTISALSALSSHEIVSELYSKQSQTKIFSDLEVGKIGEREFLSELSSLLKVDNSEKVKHAWNLMLLDLRVERVNFLKKLREIKSIYMLSNINIIHEKYLRGYLKSIELEDFYTLFDKVYFSHEVGMRKPNKGIFEHVLSDSFLDIKKTIFIDDSIQHVESARELGLEAILLEKPNTFIVGN